MLLVGGACFGKADEVPEAVAFYRLRHVGGNRLPITLRYHSPAGGINLSSGSLTLLADGRYVGRYRLYDAVPGEGGGPGGVTDLEDRGRYRRRGRQLQLESSSRRHQVVLDLMEGDGLRGPLVGAAHPLTDTLGTAWYERDVVPPPGAR